MAIIVWDPGINQYNPTVELELTARAPNIAENYTIVDYVLRIKRPSQVKSTASKNYSVVIDGGIVVKGTTTIGGIGTKIIASGNVRIPHNSNGEKKNMPFSFTMDIGLTWSGRATGNASSSGTMDLATIPRASSISSFPNFEIDKAFTVKISRASSNFTHELRLYVGSKHIGTWSGVGTSRTITLTTSQQNEIYKTIPNAVHSQVTMYCYTYSGNTLIGSRTSQIATASVPSSIRPSIGSIHLKDLKDKNIPVYIQGLSNFQIGVRDAVGAKYSTIATYEYRFGGESKRSIQSVLETGIVNRSGNYTIEVIVTDTRGRTGSKAVTVYIEPYGNPVVRNMTVERTDANGNQDPLGTYIRVVSNGEYFKVNNENWASISINARAIGDEVWNSIHYELVDSGGTFNIDEVIAGFPITKSYEVNININDRFGRRTNAYRVLPSGEVVMSWGKDGVGIGKIHERGALDVNGDVNVSGGDVNVSGGDVNVSGKLTVGGVSLGSLLATKSFTIANSGATVTYIKIAEVVRDVGTNHSGGVALIAGGGYFGHPTSDVDILQVGTRGSGVVRYLRLMKASSGSSSYGYVDNASTGRREIWIKGSSYNGTTHVNVLHEYNANFKLYTRTTTKPSGWVDATQITIGQ